MMEPVLVLLSATMAVMERMMGMRQPAPSACCAALSKALHASNVTAKRAGLVSAAYVTLTYQNTSSGLLGAGVLPKRISARRASGCVLARQG